MGGVTDPELSVNLVDTRHLNIWVSRGLPKFDAVVATSSLSELDMDAFFWYYNTVLPHTTYLLYAYSKVWPSPELVQEKLELLLARFTIVSQVESNHNNTVSAILRANAPS